MGPMRRFRHALFLLGCAASPVGVAAQASRLDSLDAYVRAQMGERRIPGLSLAIIQDGRVAVARAYGVVDETSHAPVTTATLFQAGSISKPVAATAALRLVDEGKIDLDTDVNRYLRSWRVPANDGCDAAGQKIDFPATQAERLANGDPRLSIEERYPTHDGYVSAVSRVATDLEQQRLLIDQDALQYIRTAEQSAIGR